MNRLDIRKQVVEYIEEKVEKLVNKEKENYDLVRFCTMSHNFLISCPLYLARNIGTSIKKS